MAVSPTPTVIRLATRGEIVHIVINVTNQTRYQRYKLVHGQPVYEDSVPYCHQDDAIAHFESELGVAVAVAGSLEGGKEKFRVVETRPLTDRQRADMDYNRDHCRGCGGEFDTRWRICPNERCVALNP